MSRDSHRRSIPDPFPAFQGSFYEVDRFSLPQTGGIFVSMWPLGAVRINSFS